jgi:hypothetical protein
MPSIIHPGMNHPAMLHPSIIQSSPVKNLSSFGIGIPPTSIISHQSSLHPRYSLLIISIGEQITPNLLLFLHFPGLMIFSGLLQYKPKP